jgi:hypothetical protein
MMPDAALRALDAEVEEALASGEESALSILGVGEISVVLGWPQGAPRVAAKRLPLFPGRAAFDAYAEVLGRYLAALRSAGLSVIETELRAVVHDDGRIAGYCLQPALPAESLLHRRLRAVAPSSGLPLVREVVEAAQRAVGERVGLDAQVANWAVDDGRLLYLDVTTPLLSREDGSSELDPNLFLAALPWLLRAPVRRFVLPGLRRRYHQVRSVLLDVCANLIKERLEAWLPAFLEAANERLASPLGADEVRRDYARDARTWATMLSLRRADRWWQRTVRRRPYRFLLPRGITR